MSQYDEVVLAGGRILRVHTSDKCAGQVCGIHNPSDHPLRHAPRIWRDERALMERECEHDVGHPDPDGLAFLRRTQGPEAARIAADHGCDGCCRPARKPIPIEFVKRRLPRTPLLLPVVKRLDTDWGRLFRQWMLCWALVCLVFIVSGSTAGPLFIGLLVGIAYAVTTTFLIRHYKHHHPQYFRRSNS